jgi:hypothetical protein
MKNATIVLSGAMALFWGCSPSLALDRMPTELSQPTSIQSVTDVGGTAVPIIPASYLVFSIKPHVTTGQQRLAADLRPH